MKIDLKKIDSNRPLLFHIYFARFSSFVLYSYMLCNIIVYYMKILHIRQMFGQLCTLCIKR